MIALCFTPYIFLIHFLSPYFSHPWKKLCMQPFVFPHIPPTFLVSIVSLCEHYYRTSFTRIISIIQVQFSKGQKEHDNIWTIMGNHEKKGDHTIWFVYPSQYKPFPIRQIKAQQKCASKYHWQAVQYPALQSRGYYGAFWRWESFLIFNILSFAVSLLWLTLPLWNSHVSSISVLFFWQDIFIFQDDTSYVLTATVLREFALFFLIAIRILLFFFVICFVIIKFQTLTLCLFFLSLWFQILFPMLFPLQQVFLLKEWSLFPLCRLMLSECQTTKSPSPTTNVI